MILLIIFGVSGTGKTTIGKRLLSVLNNKGSFDVDHGNVSNDKQEQLDAYGSCFVPQKREEGGTRRNKMSKTSSSTPSSLKTPHVDSKKLTSKESWIFLDGDDFHSKENKDKMSSGYALNDTDRMPWLASMQETLWRLLLKEEYHILACSALKEIYRQILVKDLPSHSIIYFIYLKTPTDILYKRMNERIQKEKLSEKSPSLSPSKSPSPSSSSATSSFLLPITLLKSQLKDLEEPTKFSNLNEYYHDGNDDDDDDDDDDDRDKRVSSQSISRHHDLSLPSSSASYQNHIGYLLIDGSKSIEDVCKSILRSLSNLSII